MEAVPRGQMPGYALYGWGRASAVFCFFFISIGLVQFSLREVSALPPAVITGDIMLFLYMIMSVEGVLWLLLTLSVCACRCAGCRAAGMTVGAAD